MKFDKELLIDLVDFGSAIDGDGSAMSVVNCEQVDARRWESVNEMIFSHKDKLYSSTYRLGLTECQESSPYEYDAQEVECPEVEAYQSTVTKYRAVE